MSKGLEGQDYGPDVHCYRLERPGLHEIEDLTPAINLLRQTGHTVVDAWLNSQDTIPDGGVALSPDLTPEDEEALRDDYGFSAVDSNRPNLH